MGPFAAHVTAAAVRVVDAVPDPRFRRDAALAASLVVLAVFDVVFVLVRRRLRRR